MNTGTIFNIQKYSVHDGPGIRTTVFFKGCPLNCWWCHNPESQLSDREIMFYPGRCTACGECIKKCSHEASKITGGKLVYNREKCTGCGDCIDSCPANAREIAGMKVTVDHTIKEIIKDRIFYDESGGGVTFSGGEPLMQHEFLKELLIGCRDEGINTVIDTSGFAASEILKGILPYSELFLYDLKFMNDEMHRKYTGVSNNIILENIRTISDAGKRIFARIPIITCINDNDENIAETGRFLSGLDVEQVNILPYHNIGMDKYGRLGKRYNLIDTIEPTEEHMLDIAAKLKGYGLKVKIGG